MSDVFYGREEYGASQPFPFFAHFDLELAKAVREGRRAEFAKFPEFQDSQKRETIPDPTSETTFRSAKLNWDEATKPSHAEWLGLYRELLKIRHLEIVPRLKNIAGNSGTYQVLGEGAVAVQWGMGDGSRLMLVANLSDHPLVNIRSRGRWIWSIGDRREALLGPWGVTWSIEDNN